MENLTKLQNIIKDSSISDEDKGFWNEKLSMPNIPTIVIDSLLEYIEANPEELAWSTDILKRKLIATENNDKQALSEILKEEEDKLNSIN